MIYQETYDQLLAASRQIVGHRERFAKETLHHVVQDYVGMTLSNEELLGHILAEALSKRVDRQLLDARNIYVQEFDVPQTELFYSMAEAVPFVGVSHSVANQYAVGAVDGAPHVGILDIGVGQGRQLGQLLQMLGGAPGRHVKQVDVVAVDPVEQNIIDSRNVVQELAPQLPFAVTYRYRCGMVEEMSSAEMAALARPEGGSTALVVNSAFTLHHTSHDPGDELHRTELLERIAALRPAAFTLIEPNSNHDTEDLPRRVHHAWQHYGTVFALVDEADIDASHKHLIKQKFFGREIQDIFAVSDRFRSERHELYEHWLWRLHRAGFTPVPSAEIDIRLPEYCRADCADGLVRMDYRELTIVAVFAMHA